VHEVQNWTVPNWTALNETMRSKTKVCITKPSCEICTLLIA